MVFSHLHYIFFVFFPFLFSLFFFLNDPNFWGVGLWSSSYGENGSWTKKETLTELQHVVWGKTGVFVVSVLSVQIKENSIKEEGF